MDLQLFFDSYIHERIEGHRARAAETTDGVGDLTTRLKINLWGDDGGTTAFAIMPFIKARRIRTDWAMMPSRAE